MKRISVIIPTYNRIEILSETLERLSRQTLSPSYYEVILIDDGSTDATMDKINFFQTKYTYSIRYYSQINSGPAAARNRGIHESDTELLLFLGDDIFADIRLLETHLEMHDKYPALNYAVLGYIDWAPELKITSLMRYMNRGPQFAYPRIKNIYAVGYRYFYSSNISIKKEFLLKNGIFDEKFKSAAYEDTELGYRLEQKGLKILFAKNAIGYHYHQIDYDYYKKRAMLIGRETRLLQEIHPAIFARKERQLLRYIIRSVLPLLEPVARWCSNKSIGSDLIYRLLFLHYFHLGYQKHR